MEADYYVGMDVHSKTTTLVAYDKDKRRIKTGTVSTEPKRLIGELAGLEGRVALTFEESTMSQWLYEVLSPHVDTLVVCDPHRNRRRFGGSKSDVIDADLLAQRLRSGDLEPVFHGHHETLELKELTRCYEKVVRDRTRAKNQLKAIFRSCGVPTDGSTVYKASTCQQWLDKLPRRSLKLQALCRYQQLELLDQLVEDIRAEMLEEAGNHKAVRLLQSIPGVGPVRACRIVGQMRTPTRFRTRAQLWSYAGLSVVQHTSSDYEVHGDGVVRKRRSTTRGLNPRFCHPLKDAFKGAAIDQAKKGGLCHDEFLARRRKGQKAELIRLTFARRVATLCLTLWKRGERFDKAKFKASHDYPRLVD